MTTFYHILFPVLYAQEEVVALGGDMDPNFRSVGFIIVFAIFLFLLLFHFYNLFVTTFKRNGNANFFLSTKYKMKGESYSCYLIKIENRYIDVISSVCLTQGSDIELDLSCVPNFPSESSWIKGTVSSFKPVQGAAKSFVISIKIDDGFIGIISRYLMINGTSVES
jgi:hypothetical protein